MPAFFPEGNTPVPFDQEQRSLQKILAETIAGGGGGGGGGGSTLTIGAGAPGALASGTMYWDETNKLFYVFDADGANIH